MQGIILDNSSFLDASQAQEESTSLSATAEPRLALLKRIGEARNSTVISYLTSIRDGGAVAIYDSDNRILERHLEMARKAGSKNIDLVINTYGGSGVMGWNFHTLFRDYFPNARLGVFVPYMAYSAGTQICLGCDEIIMGRSSVLGPADIAPASTISGVLDLISDVDKSNRMNAEQQLSLLFSGSHSLQIGELYRFWKEDRRVLLSALRSRKSPLSDKENEKIVHYFLDGVGVHGQGIRRREVAEAGVSFLTPIEKTGLENEVAQLFAHYADMMKLFSPLIDKRDRDSDDAAAPQVVVESVYETTAALRSGRSDRDWQTRAAKPREDFGAANQSSFSGEWVSLAHAPPAPDTGRKRRR